MEPQTVLAQGDGEGGMEVGPALTPPPPPPPPPPPRLPNEVPLTRELAPYDVT